MPSSGWRPRISFLRGTSILGCGPAPIPHASGLQENLCSDAQENTHFHSAQVTHDLTGFPSFRITGEAMAVPTPIYSMTLSGIFNRKLPWVKEEGIQPITSVHPRGGGLGLAIIASA